MKKIMNYVVLLKSLFIPLFFILGLCLGACYSNNDGDDMLSVGFSGELSTGHYLGYEVKSNIPVNSDTLEITLFVGHGPDIKHFYWYTDIGSEWLPAEIENLDFSIELYDSEHPRHETIVEAFDYLSDEYLIDVKYPDPRPEYVTPSDWKIIYASSFKIILNVKDIIVEEYGIITFYIYQIDRENGNKQPFNNTNIYYEVVGDEIVFSSLRKPVPYDYHSEATTKE